MEKLSDAEIEARYRRSQGLDTVDVGSVALLRKEVNRKLIARGYAKLKGYKPKKQLFAINKSL